MLVTIDKESKQRKRMPVNIDNMAERYKTTSTYYTFTSPDLWTIEKNLFYLLRYSTQKQFEPKYKMRPDYLSYDEYGTVQMAHLLMYVNGVGCIEDFSLVTVVVPSYSAIVAITKDKFSKQKTDNLTSIDW